MSEPRWWVWEERSAEKTGADWYEVDLQDAIGRRPQAAIRGRKISHYCGEIDRERFTRLLAAIEN